VKVLDRLELYGHVPGVQARIARELGVTQATISRDVKALLYSHVRCPVCDSFVPRERLKR
jgi:hypothetical protein